MTVQLDVGKAAELTPDKTRRIDYGYAVDGSHAVRADRIIATGDVVPKENLRGRLLESDLSLYIDTPAASEALIRTHDAIAHQVMQHQQVGQQLDYNIGL